ncbi:MAG: DUF7507 domain-containing protein, partial [Pseudomarimonas sp.]
ITVAAGTAGGSYAYPYTICLLAPNQAVCDTATATVLVTAATIVAVNDAASTPANTPVATTVTTNDTNVGGAIDPDSVNITTSPTNGSVNCVSNVCTYTPNPGFSGIDTYQYEVCLLAPNDGVCDIATVTITVTPTIDALNDGPFMIPATGGITPSVIVNDFSNGAAAVIGGNVSLTPGLSPNAGLVMNADGTITVASGTEAGTYLYPYTICLLAPNQAVCDSAVATVVVAAAPAISVVKSAGIPSGNTAGSTIAYSFLVTNTGNTVLTGIVVNDAQLDAAAVCLTTTLAPTATTTCTGTHTLTQAEVNAGVSNNSATVTGTPPVGPPVTSPPSVTSTPIAANPALTVVKSAGVPSGNTAGSTIAYTFLVTNTGNVTLTGIVINDAQLDAAAVCMVTTLAPGATTTCTGTHTLTQAEVNAGVSNNSATATGTPPVGPPVTSPPSVTSTPIAANPSLTVVKSAGVPSGITAGSTIAYSFLVTNTGNVTLTGIVINDAQLDAAAVCVTTTLAPGATTTCTGTHTLTQAEVNAGVSNNSATVTGTPPVGPPVSSPPSVTSTPIPANPALTVVKSAGAPSGNVAGSTVPYTFLVRNTGNVTLTGIVINDAQLDAAAVCLATTLLPGATTSCTGVHTLTQVEVDAGTSVNSATATGTPPVGPPVTSPPSVTVTPIPASPSLTVVKTAGTPSGNTAGSTIAYSFLVTNTGNVTLTGIVINDAQLDAPAACLTTTLAPSATTTCTGTHTLTQAEVDAGTSNNSATATGTPPGGNPPVTSPPSVTVTPIAPNPSITVVKTAGTPSGNTAGSTIAYSFLVTNTGNVTLTGIVINDAQLDAAAVCLATTLAPSATTTCTGTHTLTQAEIDAGTANNSATVTGTPPGGNPPVTSPPSETVTPIPANPSISVVKTAGMPSGNTAGSTIAYSFLVTNTGNVTLTGIVINDAQLDAPAVCPVTTLAPLATTTCTGTHTLTQAEVDAGTSNNTATATGTPPGGNPPVTSPPSVTVTPIPANPSLTVVKTAGTPSGNTAGSTIAYSFLVTNTGNVTLTGIVINDAQLDAPAVCMATTLAPLATTTCTGTHTLTQAEVDAGTANNTATATGTPPGGNPPVTSPPSVTVTPIAANPSINLVKTADAVTLPTVGQAINYTFVATNTGNVTLSNVSIVDPLPNLSALTCTPLQPAVLAPGASMTCTASYTVTVTDLNNGGVTNTATAGGTPPVGPPVIDDDTVPIAATPVLNYSKLLTGESLIVDGRAQPGEVLTYTISVRNDAGVPAPNTVIIDRVPLNTTFVSGSPTWSCAVGAVGGTACQVTVTVPAFSGGSPGVATATFSVRVNDPLPESVQSITNVVTINAIPPVDCAANPTAPQCVVTPTMNLRFEKTVASVDTTGPGSFNVRYQLTVRNVGGAASAYTLSDTLGFTTQGVAFNGNAVVTSTGGTVNPALAGGSFVPANGVAVQLSATNNAIASGATHTYLLVVPISVNANTLGNELCTGGQGNGLFNAARIDGDIDIGSSACAPINIEGRPAIRLLKTVELVVDANANGYGDVGDVLNYQLEISNVGSQSLSALRLIDRFVTDLECDATTVAGQPITVLLNDQVFFGSFEPQGNGALVPTDSVQCFASHTLTAADVLARRVTNVATASGRGNNDETVSSTSTAIYSAFP